MPVAQAAFTQAMSRVPAPVTVATTTDRDGRHWGFTASSFTSLSLDPQLVLICLDKAASTHAAFTAADRFLVNILADDQSEVAVRFATSNIDRFAAGDLVTCELGLPGLESATARLACTTHRILDGGDHSILVGRVEQLYTGSRPPLVYSDRRFTRPVPLDQPARAR
ncbi:flavin reductase family protein [Kitasatospora sp. NBC_01560]|uniref:flavin reductase family protein n=1 Tax=Kitasatospora sp. NBC_01560 TaxID=2975965 RepID=UPI0038633851